MVFFWPNSYFRDDITQYLLNKSPKCAQIQSVHIIWNLGQIQNVCLIPQCAQNTEFAQNPDFYHISHYDRALFLQTVEISSNCRNFFNLTILQTRIFQLLTFLPTILPKSHFLQTFFVSSNYILFFKLFNYKYIMEYIWICWCTNWYSE